MAKNAMTGNIKVLGAILIVILFFAACKQPIDKSVERISIKLTMGNGSPFQIGYLTDSVMGEVTSISSLTISGDNIYLLDQANRNVKILNIPSRALKKVSAPLSDSSTLLSDIFIVAGKIYVSSYGDLIFVLDEQLEILDQIKIEHPYGEKKFFFYQNNLYINTKASDSWQVEKSQVYAIATNLSDMKNLRRDTISGGGGYDAYEELIDGYKIKIADREVCYTNGEYSQCMLKAVPTVPFASRNVVIREGKLAFFEFLKGDSIEVVVQQ